MSHSATGGPSKIYSPAIPTARGGPLQQPRSPAPHGHPACHARGCVPPSPPPTPPASAYTALGARRGPWVFPSAGVVGSPRQDILGAMLHLAWDGWLSWRGTHCLVLWTPWTGRRHSLHCLGWLRLRFPMLGCQGAEHSPGRVPTAALRHATSHTQVVAHMYITCTPMHTDMHQYRHTSYVCPPPPPSLKDALPSSSHYWHMYPGTLTHPATCCSKAFLGHMPGHRGSVNPTREISTPTSQAPPAPVGWVQGYLDAGCFMGGHGVPNLATHRGGWLESGGTGLGAVHRPPHACTYPAPRPAWHMVGA